MGNSSSQSWFIKGVMSSLAPILAHIILAFTLTEAPHCSCGTHSVWCFLSLGDFSSVQPTLKKKKEKKKNVTPTKNKHIFIFPPENTGFISDPPLLTHK